MAPHGLKIKIHCRGCIYLCRLILWPSLPCPSFGCTRHFVLFSFHLHAFNVLEEKPLLIIKIQINTACLENFIRPTILLAKLTCPSSGFSCNICQSTLHKMIYVRVPQHPTQR